MISDGESGSVEEQTIKALDVPSLRRREESAQGRFSEMLEELLDASFP